MTGNSSSWSPTSTTSSGSPSPTRDDLAARINDPGFRNLAGNGIAQKLNLIRKLGNNAVHEVRPIPPRAALDVLRELHHVVIWAAFRFSTDPQSVPTGAAFDPSLAAKSAPLTREEVGRLAVKFRLQDEAHRKALADRDELAAAKDAEIAATRTWTGSSWVLDEVRAHATADGSVA